MDEKSEPKKPKPKKPLKILRDRRGGVPAELTQFYKRQNRTRKRITELLGGGPKTIPEIAQGADMPTDEALWHVMAMKKYDVVVEGEERDGYFEYVLKEPDR